VCPHKDAGAGACGGRLSTLEPVRRIRCSSDLYSRRRRLREKARALARETDPDRADTRDRSTVMAVGCKSFFSRVQAASGKLVEAPGAAAARGLFDIVVANANAPVTAADCRLRALRVNQAQADRPCPRRSSTNASIPADEGVKFLCSEAHGFVCAAAGDPKTPIIRSVPAPVYRAFPRLIHARSAAPHRLRPARNSACFLPSAAAICGLFSSTPTTLNSMKTSGSADPPVAWRGSRDGDRNSTFRTACARSAREVNWDWLAEGGAGLYLRATPAHGQGCGTARWSISSPSSAAELDRRGLIAIRRGTQKKGRFKQDVLITRSNLGQSERISFSRTRRGECFTAIDSAESGQNRYFFWRTPCLPARTDIPYAAMLRWSIGHAPTIGEAPHCTFHARSLSRRTETRIHTSRYTEFANHRRAVVFGPVSIHQF